jgi:hypothetical protein
MLLAGQLAFTDAPQVSVKSRIDQVGDDLAEMKRVSANCRTAPGPKSGGAFLEVNASPGENLPGSFADNGYIPPCTAISGRRTISNDATAVVHA